MEKALVLFILTRNIIPYFFLLEWNEEKRRSIIKASVAIVIMLCAYFTIDNTIEIDSSLLGLVTITIPSFIIFYCLTQYKDARYLLTFVMVDTISAIMIYLVDSVALVANMSQAMTLIVYIICFGIICINLKRISVYYHELMETIEKGLGMVTTISIVYCVTFYFCIMNPIFIKDRIEYLPITVVVCFLIILSYIVIFRTLTLINEIYEIKDKEGDLTSQLKLQESELKLKELYYKLAYIDGLTGLKNRTAYEERLVTIQTKARRNQKIWYISLDLNDLKVINDKQGHHRGDLLIQSMASALKIVFTQNGNVFRIGGDEFVVIIEKELTEFALREKLKELEELLNEYGERTNMSIKVAWGYSLYIPSENDKIVDAAIRADALMYAKKRTMKKKMSVC